MKETARTLCHQPSERRLLISILGIYFQEDHLFKLGKSLTEALSSEPVGQGGLPPDVVGEMATLSGADWSVCLERYVDLPR